MLSAEKYKTSPKNYLKIAKNLNLFWENTYYLGGYMWVFVWDSPVFSNLLSHILSKLLEMTRISMKNDGHPFLIPI